MVVAHWLRIAVAVDVGTDAGWWDAEARQPLAKEASVF